MLFCRVPSHRIPVCPRPSCHRSSSQRRDEIPHWPRQARYLCQGWSRGQTVHHASYQERLWSRMGRWRGMVWLTWYSLQQKILADFLPPPSFSGFPFLLRLSRVTFFMSGFMMKTRLVAMSLLDVPVSMFKTSWTMEAMRWPLHLSVSRIG